MKKDLNILSGDGTFENPYVINQNNNSNYVDNFVKLGNDLWKVNYDDGNILKMYLTKTINDTGSVYGNNSLYDYNDFWSLANYYNYGSGNIYPVEVTGIIMVIILI